MDEKPDPWRNVRDGIGLAASMLICAFFGAMLWQPQPYSHGPEEDASNLVVGAIGGAILGLALWKLNVALSKPSR